MKRPKKTQRAGAEHGRLAIPRLGWENEHLATFLLSQISFVAHPITVADDIGSDFFCTIFERRVKNGLESLFPKNSFAIQVKSNLQKIPATNKIDYLFNLELPFFVGVVNRSHLRLSIYSGGYLPMMFSHYGRPSALTLIPLSDIASAGYYNGSPMGPCTLGLAHVCDISTDDRKETLREKARTISKLCSIVHSNISARASQEYIFKLDGDGRETKIMAGPSSFNTFRHNFYLRLAEVFYNFEWTLDRRPERFSKVEFLIYDRLYKELTAQSSELPSVLQEIYGRLLKRVSE